ncbi:MAG TPA: kelch repeat-containing protein [Candidatus Krumholzibacteria bacterium]|nr:kelch repeat-containing protein [Candidatus Krumholzibacteria bacterium]
MFRRTPRRFATIGIIAFVATVSDVAAQSWTELTPAAGPPAPAARRNASAILDPVDNRMVIFGGFAATFTNDIWAFDLDTNTWENLTPAPGPPAPAPRLFPASVYDPHGHRMITWSGQGPGVFFNDVWAFDLDANTWSQFTPTGGPPNIRYGVGYAWDPLARDLVTFAGFTNQGRFDDVWRFNDQASTWTDVSPVTNPLARCLHAACYDPIDHRMIMYAGQNNDGALDDIWALDLATDTWTELTPASMPAGRYFTALVYDAANHRATVFGGQTTLAPVNEVWVFDLWSEAWTQLSPGGTPPSARWGSGGVYDGADDRMIVFGGFDSAVRNDVWSLDGLSNTSTGVRPSSANAATLHPNHPNPFNPSTTIRFDLAARGDATLRIYDVHGRAVRTLFAGVADAGVTTLPWNGRDDAGRAAGSGVYFYRLETSSGTLSRKMVLLK